MNNTIKIFSAFLVGTVLGVVVANQLLKTKYEQIAQEEIDSVKEVFSKKEPPVKNNVVVIQDPKEKASLAKDKANVTQYANILHGQGYVDYSKSKLSLTPEESDEPVLESKPYIIAPEDFGEADGYETISLTYYSDGTITDDDDNPVENPEDSIGSPERIVQHFGEYEDDSVFVRNDKLKCDYEILRDQRVYSEVSKRKPHDFS